MTATDTSTPQLAYPYIWALGQHRRSTAEQLDGECALAAADGAPPDAVYRRDWSRITPTEREHTLKAVDAGTAHLVTGPHGTPLRAWIRLAGVGPGPVRDAVETRAAALRDRVERAMLVEVLGAGDTGVPDGWTVKVRERHDEAIGHVYRDVVVAPPDVDPDTFGFGSPGAYAHIRADVTAGGYVVGVFARKVGWNLQSAGQVIVYPDAAAALAEAVSAVNGELDRQRRGW